MSLMKNVSVKITPAIDKRIKSKYLMLSYAIFKYLKFCMQVCGQDI